MAVWKLKRLGPVSAATGEPLGADVEIVTALFGEDETSEDGVRGSGFQRKDFLLEEATEEALAGAFCTWRTRTPPAKPQEERRFDLGMAREFLQRLLAEDREERAPVCLTLALLLARKRRLVILRQDAASLTVRWPRETETFVVPAPEVSEADAELLQQDLLRLFHIELAQPASRETTAEASPAQAPTEPATERAENRQTAGDPPRDDLSGGGGDVGGGAPPGSRGV